MPDSPEVPASELLKGVFSRVFSVLQEQGMSQRDRQGYESLIKPLVEKPASGLHVHRVHDREPVSDSFPLESEDDSRKLFVSSSRKRVILAGQPPHPGVIPKKQEYALRQIRIDSSHWPDEEKAKFKNHLEGLGERIGNLIGRSRFGQSGGEDKAMALATHRDKLRDEAVQSRTTITFQDIWFDENRPKQQSGGGQDFGETVVTARGGFRVLESYKSGAMTIEVFGSDQRGDDLATFTVGPAEATAMRQLITKTSQRQPFNKQR